MRRSVSVRFQIPTRKCARAGRDRTGHVTGSNNSADRKHVTSESSLRRRHAWSWQRGDANDKPRVRNLIRPCTVYLTQGAVVKQLCGWHSGLLLRYEVCPFHLCSTTLTNVIHGVTLKSFCLQWLYTLLNISVPRNSQWMGFKGGG